MRTMRKRIETLCIRPVTVQHTFDGDQVTYGPAVEFKGTKWPAGGRVQAEMYGNKVQDVFNVKVIGPYVVEQDETTRQPVYVFAEGRLKLNDGVCILATGEEQPDFQIVSIREYHPLLLEVMRI